jgi:multidrug efflux pump subunit AcrA (membrane-fusion protein)
MSESQASLVQAAASATVRTAGQTLHAEIGMLATALDPATRTLRLRLDLDNPDHELQPGTLVEVEFGGSLPGTFHASADSNTGLPLLAADRSATAQ